MKRRLGAVSLDLARTRIGGRLIIWILRQMGSVLPFPRLHETPNLLAFFHPNPSYAFHALIVPRRYIASLNEIEATDSPFLRDVFITAQRLADEYHLEQNGYQLVVNGGKYQEFPWLHFHLISDANLIHQETSWRIEELFS